MIAEMRNFINDIRKVSPVKSYVAAFSDMLKMNEIKERSIQSKQGTGIAALHVTDHVNGMRIGYKTIGDGLAIPRNADLDGVDLSQMKNAANEDIPTLLNQMINMFVDGVKDPIGFDLNFTIDTAAEVLFMMRAGVPLKTIALLMNHPAVREYTEASVIGKSKYSKKEAWQMRMDVEKKYGLRSKDGKLELVSAKSISQEALEKAVRKNLNGPLVLSEYIRIRNHASVLSEHVNASRIDTIAGGKTTSELEMILRQIDKLKQNPGITNWEKLFEKGGYLYYHYNALKEAQKMMTPFFVHLKNPKVYAHYLKMIDHVSRNRTMDLDTKARILDRFKSDFIASSILHSKPKMFGISETVPLKDQERELLSGPNSVANMLNKAKDSSNNMLIKHLFPVFHRSKNSATEHLENGELHNIKMFNQRLDVFERNQIVDAWRSLFKENDSSKRSATHTDVVQLNHSL
jgi:hypothetical protein